MSMTTSVRQAHDGGSIAAELAALVNAVYEVAEEGLWRDGWARTNPAEMGELIAAGQIAAAERDGELAGTIHFEDVEDDAMIFGMLAAASDHRSAGVGRALVDFAEQRARKRGKRTMRLELLVPRDWQHPSKEFLKGWYGRRGYRVTGTGAMDELYPHLAPMLACPCELLRYAKPL
jgi:GNAT superfamily N-acetyltransferase